MTTNKQGEPVAWLRFRSHRVAADDVIEGLEICEPGETGDDGGPAFPVYATPQPTEQQPRLPLPDFITDPDDSDEGASLWDHGFKQGWNSCLEAVAEDMQHTEEQPDIAQLVEQQKRIVS